MIQETGGSLTSQGDGNSTSYGHPPQESIKCPPAVDLRLAICVAAGLVGVIVTVTSFYPGYMSTDSVGQLREAREGSFEDFAPPIMPAVWSVLDRVVPGPLGMLVLQNLIFWASLSLIVFLARIGSLAAAGLILAVGFFPPNFILLAHIWKDVGMGVTLLSAYSLFLLADRKGSRTLLVAGFCGLFYPLAVRHNGALAVLPLAIWGGYIATRVTRMGASRPHIRGLALGVAAFALLLFLVGTTNRVLTGGRTTYPVQGTLLHDLAGISARSDSFLMPGYISREKPDVNLEVLKRIYSPHIDTIFWRKDSTPTLFWTSDEQNFSELKSTWIRVVPTHTDQYLAHRWDVLKSQLSIGTARVCYPYGLGIEKNEFGIDVLRSPLNVSIMKILGQLEHGLLFRGWFYFILVIVLPFVISIVFRDTAVQTMALGLSGSVYAIPFLFVSQGCEFRYMWWPVLATVMLPIVALCKPDGNH